MDQNLFNQNQPQPIQPSNWYTTQQIANGFECSQEAIRSCKFKHKDKLIESIHWKGVFIKTEGGEQSSVAWSEAGILKLAELMDRTEKAQDFVVEMRVQEELKKRMVKLPDFNNPIAAARAWADECEAKTKALALIEEQKPKVEFAEKIVNTGNGVSIGDFAKSIGWGQNKLFEWLRKNKYLMSNNIPYQSYIDNGYFKVIEWVLEKKNEAKFKTLITGKGQEYISRKIY